MELITLLFSLVLFASPIRAQLSPGDGTTFDATSRRLRYSTGCRAGNSSCTDCSIPPNSLSGNWRECSGRGGSWFQFSFFGENFAIYGLSHRSLNASSWPNVNIQAGSSILVSNWSPPLINDSQYFENLPSAQYLLYDRTLSHSGDLAHQVNVTINSGIFLLDTIVVDRQPMDLTTSRTSSTRVLNQSEIVGICIGSLVGFSLILLLCYSRKRIRHAIHAQLPLTAELPSKRGPAPTPPASVVVVAPTRAESSSGRYQALPPYEAAPKDHERPQ